MSKKQVTSGTKAKTIVNISIHIFLEIPVIHLGAADFLGSLTSFRGEKGSYVTTFFPKTYTINNYVKLFTDTSIFELPENVCEYFYHYVTHVSFQTFFAFQYLIQCQRMRF